MHDHVVHPAFQHLLDRRVIATLTRDDWIMIVVALDEAIETGGEVVRARLEPIADDIRTNILGHPLMAAHNGGH